MDMTDLASFNSLTGVEYSPRALLYGNKLILFQFLVL